MGFARGLKTLHDLHIRTVREKEVGSQKRFTFCVSVVRQSHARCIRPTSFVSLKTILRVIHINKLTTTVREHITPVSIAFFSIFILYETRKDVFQAYQHIYEDYAQEKPISKCDAHKQTTEVRSTGKSISFD